MGYPVYHYHLHVVALPVVEKEVRYSKRCKDPELVGKVKEVIHQISHSKKWASQKVMDENGKSHIIKRITDERELKKLIYDKLKGAVSSGVAKKLDSILEVLRSEAYLEDLPLQTDRIHVTNGTLFLDGRFTEDKEYCRNRLTVTYAPDAPAPERWLSFLHELLDTEDIPTLQEYMGYCLIPTTKAQKMLMLVGKGGEGKSRIGSVLRAILGDNMVNGNLNKVETNRFARADLEHALLMVDDDMKTEGLPQTNYLKSSAQASPCRRPWIGSICSTAGAILPPTSPTSCSAIRCATGKLWSWPT